jgi:hypothetical protein
MTYRKAKKAMPMGRPNQSTLIDSEWQWGHCIALGELSFPQLEQGLGRIVLMCSLQ